MGGPAFQRKVIALRTLATLRFRTYTLGLAAAYALGERTVAASFLDRVPGLSDLDPELSEVYLSHGTRQECYSKTLMNVPRKRGEDGCGEDGQGFRC